MAATKAPAEQLITENIDVWASAIKKRGSQGRGSNKKIELYGIKKLRGLILELAVRGLLVPQDSNDEPASVLLEKIAAEKEQLIENGKIKRQKSLSEIARGEKPFDLSNGWEFVRLGEICDLNGGYAFKSSNYTEEGARVVRISDFDERGFKNDRIVRHEYTDELEQYVLKEKNILMAMTGGTVGKCLLVQNINEKMVVNQRVATMSFFTEVLPSYVKFALQTSTVQKVIEEAKNSTNDNISMSNIKGFIIATPPEAEVVRICTKVNELMALCDQLEQQTETSLTAHQTLVEALLNTLLTAAQTSTHSSAGLAKTDKEDKANPKSTVAKESGLTAKNTQSTPVARGAGSGGNEDALVSNSGVNSSSSSFESAWNRIAQHFDVLFTTEHSIDQLKKTILQLAVMGKLVPQDPNDEPASVLLEKIAKEKEQLIKDKKIKKQKPLLEISNDEKLFSLPEGWEWCRISEIAQVGTGATPSRTNPEYFTPAEVNWVTSGETGKDYVFETKEQVSKKAIAETNVSIYPVGTLLVAMYGQGKTRGQITELMIEAGTNQACAAIQMIDKSEAHRKFVKLYFQKAYEELRSLAEGGAQPNLNVGKIALTLIPIPPIAEKIRIVAKVDELIALCDSMQKHFRESKITQLNLTDAIGDSLFGRSTIIKLEEKEENKAMKISTEISLGDVEYDETAILAPLIGEEGADAKIIWNKSKLRLPEFYKQLKLEITAGFVAKPAKAEFEG